MCFVQGERRILRPAHLLQVQHDVMQRHHRGHRSPLFARFDDALHVMALPPVLNAAATRDVVEFVQPFVNFRKRLAK